MMKTLGQKRRSLTANLRWLYAAALCAALQTAAMAQTATLESAVQGEIDGLKAKATPILIGVLGIVMLFVLFGVIRKSARKAGG